MTWLSSSARRLSSSRGPNRCRVCPRSFFTNWARPGHPRSCSIRVLSTCRPTQACPSSGSNRDGPRQVYGDLGQAGTETDVAPRHLHSSVTECTKHVGSSAGCYILLLLLLLLLLLTTTTTTTTTTTAAAAVGTATAPATTPATLAAPACHCHCYCYC